MSSVDDTYLLSRGIGPSIRLIAQHWLWKGQFGWNLHPKVKERWKLIRDRDGHEIPRKIADVATGNAIWLIEESRDLPAGSIAVGFDISKSMAPATHTLPKHVSLHTLHATADIPPEWQNAFDVVHVRLLLGAVFNNDPRPILRNMICMLAPGGMLQWGEVMLDAYVLGKPPGEGMTASKKVMAQVAKRIGTAQVKPEDSWLRHLPAIFEECGLQDVECTRAGEPPREMWKYWGEVLSGAVEEIVATTGCGREYLPDLAKELSTGDYMYVEPAIVTGWKAK